MNEQEERAVSREIDLYEAEAERLRGAIKIKNEIISELMDQKKLREWVSVNESPKEPGDYLTLHSFSNYAHVFEWDGTKWLDVIRIAKDVNYWMPVPDAPKEAMT